MYFSLSPERQQLRFDKGYSTTTKIRQQLRFDTVTAEGRQRIFTERARAKQQQENIAIAKASVALVQSQLEAARGWPTPAAPEQDGTATQEARQQQIQDEYNNHFHPQRNRTTPTEDQQRRTELEGTIQTQMVPTDPQQQDEHYFDGGGGHCTHQNTHP